MAVEQHQHPAAHAPGDPLRAPDVDLSGHERHALRKPKGLGQVRDVAPPEFLTAHHRHAGGRLSRGGGFAAGGHRKPRHLEEDAGQLDLQEVGPVRARRALHRVPGLGQRPHGALGRSKAGCRDHDRVRPSFRQSHLEAAVGSGQHAKGSPPDDHFRSGHGLAGRLRDDHAAQWSHLLTTGRRRCQNRQEQRRDRRRKRCRSPCRLGRGRLSARSDRQVRQCPPPSYCRRQMDEEAFSAGSTTFTVRSEPSNVNVPVPWKTLPACSQLPSAISV